VRTKPRTIDFGSLGFTTDTASFETAPELSEPVERLFEAITTHSAMASSQKQKQPEVPFDSAFDVPMNPEPFRQPEQPDPLSTAINATIIDRSEKTVKLNDPIAFTGKREDLDQFLADLELHIMVNEQTYTNDVKKIAFALSFMTADSALSWRRAFVASKRSPGRVTNFGTFQQFTDALTKSFQPYDEPGDALDEIKILRMGNNTAEDHVNKFRILITRSKLDESSAMVIDAFRETLRVPLTSGNLEKSDLAIRRS
jgi:hypothetical protein